MIQQTTAGPCECSDQLTAGVDLRYLKQELNEITTSANTFPGANSPTPKSESVNPGYFIEYTHPVDDLLVVRAGIRADQFKAEVIDDPVKLSALGTENFTDRTYREHLDFRSPNGIQVFQPGINGYFDGELTY
ncbi:MAG: hypothetical protein O3C40_01420 [Planctomycetota bacterium]|nr:hypothetical protein [Planctomycetota bacterium]